MKETTNIRYTFDRDAKYLYPRADANGEESFLLPKPADSLFLDILEDANILLFKVRVFFPDGSIRVGYALKDYIKLNTLDPLFDGRFNSNNIK